MKNIQKSKLEENIKKYSNPKIFPSNLTFLKKFFINLNNYSCFFKKGILQEFNKNINKNYINTNIFNILGYYNKINFNRLNKLKHNNYFRNSENIFLVLDIKKSKPKIFVISNNKCVLSLTSGIIYKKMSLKQKKIKKTEKMFNLMLKAVYLSISKKIKYKNIVVQLKGTKSNLFNILLSVDRNFSKKNISLIYTPQISFGLFRFKKIKSIKKRLRKKFSRLIKN